MEQLFCYFLVSVGVVGVTSPLISGSVKLAPPVPAVAPRTSVSLAFGPRVTVLEQPDATMSIPIATVTSAFIYLFRKLEVVYERA